MALSELIRPPKRVQFITRADSAQVEETSLLDSLPVPDFIGISDNVILTIDATPRQTHTIKVLLPEHPVEEGANITDHIQALPVELVLDGVISDTPIDLVALLGEIINIGGVSRSISAWQVLKGLAKNLDVIGEFGPQLGKPFSVQTGLDFYYSMGITSLVVNRTPDTGESIHFTVHLKEIITVESVVATATAPTEAGTGSAIPSGTGTDADRGRLSGSTPGSEVGSLGTSTISAITGS